MYPAEDEEEEGFKPDSMDENLWDAAILTPVLMEVEPKSSSGTPKLVLVLHKSFDAQLGVTFWLPRNWEGGDQCPAFHLRMGWIREEVVHFGFCFSIPAAHMGIYLLGLFKTFKEFSSKGLEKEALNCICVVSQIISKSTWTSPAPCPGRDQDLLNSTPASHTSLPPRTRAIQNPS